MFQRILNYTDRFFNRPSQISIEVARIVFGICSLLIFQFKQLVISGNQVYGGWNISNYYPKGILAIICPQVPSIESFDVISGSMVLSGRFEAFEGGKAMLIIEVSENNEVYLFAGNEKNM